MSRPTPYDGWETAVQSTARTEDLVAVLHEIGDAPLDRIPPDLIDDLVRHVVGGDDDEASPQVAAFSSAM